MCFGGGGQPDIRVLGLHQMIDALIVLQVLKIPDTQGFSFFLFYFLRLREGSKGKQRGGRGGIGSYSEASRSTDMYHITVPLPSTAAQWNM